MTPPTQIVRFDGPVSWVPGPGPTGITLLGRTRGPAATPAQLSLIATTAVGLPATLQDVIVEAPGPTEVLLRSGAHDWRIACRTWQLHRDAGVAFYAAIAPRPTPWKRRLTWRILLGIAATPPGHWLLSRRATQKSNHD